jgi:hypothetical protein
MAWTEVFPETAIQQTKLAVTIDSGPLQIIDFYAPEFSAAWREHAMANAAIETVPNLQLRQSADLENLRPRSRCNP